MQSLTFEGQLARTLRVTLIGIEELCHLSNDLLASSFYSPFSWRVSAGSLVCLPKLILLD